MIEVSPGAELIIGRNVTLRRFTTIHVKEKVVIGDDALIAEMVSIRDHDHAIDGLLPYRLSGYTAAPVMIGRNTWLGAKVTVTKGVRIGDNSVVGANAVVTSDLPENALCVGVPARVVRIIHPRDQEERATSS